MSLDLLKKLAIAFVLVLFLWGGAEILRGGDDAAVQDFAIPAVTSDGSDSIVVARAVGSVTLVRSGVDWTVNGHRAAFSAVNDLFAALAETERAEIVGTNPNLHGRFEIDDAAARRLTIWEGGTATVDLLVGKQGRSFQDVYLRRPGEDDVFEAGSRLAGFVGRLVDDWRDKLIAAIEPSEVATFEVRAGGLGYSAALGEGGAWVFGDGAAGDSARITTFLDRFRALSGTGFASDADTTEFDNPDRSVVLRDATQSVLVELAFDSTNAGYWVLRDGDPTVYRIAKFRGEQLTPDRTDLDPAGG